MERKISMAEENRRRFLARTRGSRHREPAEANPAAEQGGVEPPAGPPPTALEEDAILLGQEAELFAMDAPRIQGETIQRPITAHLFVISGIAWLFTIDPVFQALTPRNFSGIPAPQLLAVFFVFPVVMLLVMWIWARWLPPQLRVLLRPQFAHWKRWLAVGFVALLVLQNRG